MTCFQTGDPALILVEVLSGVACGALACTSLFPLSTRLPALLGSGISQPPNGSLCFACLLYCSAVTTLVSRSIFDELETERRLEQTAHQVGVSVVHSGDLFPDDFQVVSG